MTKMNIDFSSSKVMKRHSSINFHFYADTQMFVHLSQKMPPQPLIIFQDVQEWMLLSILKLNPEKTEFVIFRYHAQRRKLDS